MESVQTRWLLGAGLVLSTALLASGPAWSPSSRLCDRQFGQCTTRPLLHRVVEMYQWQEVLQGEGGGARLVWSQQSLGRQHRHVNPAFPLHSHWFIAHGRPTPDPHQIGEQRLPLDLQHLPANMAVSFSRYGLYLQSSDNLAQPRPGDLRISWLAGAIVPAAAAQQRKSAVAKTTTEPAPQTPVAAPASTAIGNAARAPRQPPQDHQLWWGLAILAGALGLWLLLRRKR